MKPIRFICRVARRAEWGGWCGIERNAKDQYLIRYVPIAEIVFDKILFQCAVYAIAVPIVPGTSVSVLSPFCTHQKLETLCDSNLLISNFCLWSDLRCRNCRRKYFNTSVYLLVPANWLSTFTKLYIFDFNAAQSRIGGLNSIDSPHFMSFDNWNGTVKVDSSHLTMKQCGTIPWEHSPRCVSGSGCCEWHCSVRLQLHFVQLYWKVCVFRSVERNVYFECGCVYPSPTPYIIFQNIILHKVFIVPFECVTNIRKDWIFGSALKPMHGSLGFPDWFVKFRMCSYWQQYAIDEGIQIAFAIRPRQFDKFSNV